MKKSPSKYLKDLSEHEDAQLVKMHRIVAETLREKSGELYRAAAGLSLRRCRRFYFSTD